MSPPIEAAPEQASHRVGVLACLTAALVWSSAGLFIKRLDLPPLEIAGLRGAISALTFWFFASRSVSEWRRWTPGRATASVSVALTALCFVVATKWTTAAAAIFLQSTAPAWVLVLEWLLLGRRPRWPDLAAVAGCGLGLSMFFLGRVEGAAFSGNLVALLSGLAFGVYMLSLRSVEAPGQLPALAAGSLLTALFASALAGSGLLDSTGPVGLTYRVPDAKEWLQLAYLGVVQIGLGYVLFAFAIRRLTAIQAALLSLLEPILNPVWVYVGTGEAPGVWAILGGAIVLGTLTWHTCRAGDS